MVQLSNSSPESAATERSLQVEVNPATGVVVAVRSPDTPPQLFGLPPKQLLGCSVADLLEPHPAAAAAATGAAAAVTPGQLQWSSGALPPSDEPWALATALASITGT